MTTSTPRGTSAAAAANPTVMLFHDLIDDAAMFPPGLTPWREAIARHPQHTRAWYGAAVGPLLLAVSLADDLAAHTWPSAMPVTLIARPGTPFEQIAAGVRRCREISAASIAMVELPYSPSWRSALEWNLPLACEVLISQDWRAGLDDLAAIRRSRSDVDVRAKLRTGATETIAWPTSAQVAEFIAACVQRNLPFKLTGGMHHALRRTTDQGEQEHGFLNVLAATAVAVAHRDHPPVSELTSWLECRDARAIHAHLTSLDADAVHATRKAFTSYGCCDVTDPIADLVSLTYLVEGQPIS